MKIAELCRGRCKDAESKSRPAVRPPACTAQLHTRMWRAARDGPGRGPLGCATHSTTYGSYDFKYPKVRMIYVQFYYAHPPTLGDLMFLHYDDCLRRGQASRGAINFTSAPALKMIYLFVALEGRKSRHSDIYLLMYK